MKKILGVFFFLFSYVLWSGEPVSICIDHPKDYAILEQFFKNSFSLEEYGYVLEGAKPISIRNFGSFDNFPVTKDLVDTGKEFALGLLVRDALNVWDRLCSQQKNFVFKAVALKDSESVDPALEVQFINVSKLRDVIDKNIDLFRYVLGPTVSAQQIADKIAWSDEPLLENLQHDLTLVGIVLGFGSHNSLVGGRIETISALSISRDLPPFTPQSNLMQSKGDHSLNFLSPERYGSYYLELAGGDDSGFRTSSPLLRPSPYFANLEEELIALDKLNEPLPFSLWDRPRFVFGAYAGGPSNQPLFEYLQQTQQKILTLLKRPDFLEQFLEKIGGKKPIITCAKPAPSDTLPILLKRTLQEWSQLFWSVATRFKSKEERLAFVEAFHNPARSHREAPTMIGASRAVLIGLKRALSNLEQAKTKFKHLSKKASKDKSLHTIVPEQLYFKTTHSGLGKELKQQDYVRVGYVIEDSEGNVLFANCDTWIYLSQTIPSFAHGMQGMRVGEKRTLFVHPVLGYGALTTLPPCAALTIKVHLLDVGEGDLTTLAPLTPLNLDWLQDPEFYRDIEESIRQRPYFLGSFYRDQMERLEGLDKTALIGELDKRASENGLFRHATAKN